MEAKIYVVGIGYSPLSQRAEGILLSSERILTSHRLLKVFKNYKIYEDVKERVLVIDGVDNTMEYLHEWAKEKRNPICILASGDPMFYGIGRRIAQDMGKQNVEIISELSSIQLAFARVKEPWDNAFLMSVHGGPFPKRRINRYTVEDIPYFVKLYGKVCVLTDPVNNPKQIAMVLEDYFGRSEPLRMYVAERLGYQEERIVEGEPKDLAQMEFLDPNVVIIIWDGFGPTKRLGFQSSEIGHQKGLITKDEVRAVVIHKLWPPQRGVIWDIGAGSGSVSLELSLLFPELDVFAIEMDPAMLSLLRKNLKDLKARYRIVEGEAPEILQGLPRPDRVFVGGSGGRLEGILRYLREQNIGHIVFSVALFQNLNTILAYLGGHYQIDVTQVCSFKSKGLSESWYLVPQNPIFVVSARSK